MSLLRRQSMYPERPEVYEQPLAYSLAYDWGELHVTRAADDAYQMAPLEHVPVVSDEGTFASRIARDVREGMSLHMLLASPDEHGPEIEKTVDNPYILSAVGKCGIETVVSMPYDEIFELAVGAGIAEVDHNFAASFESMGFELDAETTYFISEGSSKREVTEQELREYAKTSQKAAILSRTAAFSVRKGYAEWAARRHFASVSLRNGNMGLASGVASAAIAVAGLNTLPQTEAYMYGTVASAVLAQSIGAAVVRSRYKRELREVFARAEKWGGEAVEFMGNVSEDITYSFIPRPPLDVDPGDIPDYPTDPLA